MCSLHHITSAVTHEVVYPLTQKSQFQMGGEHQQDEDSSLL